MNQLANETCSACHGASARLEPSEQNKLLTKIRGWEIWEEQKLHKVYNFPNFLTAWQFVNQVSEASEAQNHHPEITFTWGRVQIQIWTHSAKGLTRNDFILAAKIDAIGH